MATSPGHYQSYQIGPDAYSGNGSVDWTTSRYSGHAAVALLRAAENTTPDSKYKTYRAQCARAGIPSSPYLFMHFGASAPAEPQADALHAACQPVDRTGYVPTIDVEFPGGRSKHGITAQEALDAVTACAERVKQLFGAWPMIYTSHVVWIDPDGLNNLPAPELGKHCPLWVKYWPFPVGSPAVYDSARVDAIARPALPPPWSSYQVHQYQGDAVGYQGFPTKVDLNRVHVLAIGAQGPEVAWLQARVGADPDGDFGPKTEAAVEMFQRAHGLAVDGVAGVKTQAAASWVVLP